MFQNYVAKKYWIFTKWVSPKQTIPFFIATNTQCRTGLLLPPVLHMKNESGRRISEVISAGKDPIFLCFRIPRLEFILASRSLSIFHTSPSFVNGNSRKPLSENSYFCRWSKRGGKIQCQSQTGCDNVRVLNLNVWFLSRSETEHLNKVLRVFLQRDARAIFIKL